MEKNKTSSMLAITAAGVFLASLTHAAVLESPADGALVSGLGFISGWKCDAGTITVALNGGTPFPVAMAQPRADTRPVCGTTNNGFITQTNWNWLGEGTHTAVAYDDGVEFARSTFTVGTTGEEFVRGASAQIWVPDFPAPGESTLFKWNESTQHLELAEVEGSEMPPSSAAFYGVWDLVFTRTEGDFLFCPDAGHGSITVSQGGNWGAGSFSGAISMNERNIPRTRFVSGRVAGSGAVEHGRFNEGSISETTFTGTFRDQRGAGTWSWEVGGPTTLVIDSNGNPVEETCGGTWRATKH